MGKNNFGKWPEQKKIFVHDNTRSTCTSTYIVDMDITNYLKKKHIFYSGIFTERIIFSDMVITLCTYKRNYVRYTITY